MDAFLLGVTDVLKAVTVDVKYAIRMKEWSVLCCISRCGGVIIYMWKEFLAGDG